MSSKKVKEWFSFDVKPEKDGLYTIGSDKMSLLGLYLDGKWVKCLKPDEDLTVSMFGGWGVSELSEEMNRLRNELQTTNSR